MDRPKSFSRLIFSIPLVLASLATGLLSGQASAHGPLPGDPLLYLPLLAKEYDSHWQWEQPVPLSLLPSPPSGEAPLAAIDHQGRLHLLWDISGTTKRYIYHAFLDGMDWKAPAPVALVSGESDLLSSPVVAGDGHLHLVWRNYQGISVEDPYRLMYASFDGAAWSPAETILDSPSYYLWGMPGLDEFGRVHVISTAGDFLTYTYHSLRLPAGSWSSPQNITPKSGSVMTDWSRWLDRAGGVRFYGDDSDGILYYAYWRDGDFSIDGQTFPGSLEGRRAQLDSLDNLHVFWTDQVERQAGQIKGLFHQCLSPNLDWGQAQWLSGSRPVSEPLRAAVDDAGQFALGWKEQDTGRLWLDVWQGCDQIDQIVIPLPDISWELSAIAISHDPGRVCLLTRRSYSSSSYQAVCGDRP